VNASWPTVQDTPTFTLSVNAFGGDKKMRVASSEELLNNSPWIDFESSNPTSQNSLTKCFQVQDVFGHNSAIQCVTIQKPPATLYEARFRRAAASVGTKVLFGGGYGINGPSNVVDIYDSVTGLITTTD